MLHPAGGSLGRHSCLESGAGRQEFWFRNRAHAAAWDLVRPERTPQETFIFDFQDIEKQEGYQAWIIGIVEKGQRTARIIDKPRVIEVPAKEKEGELW